MFEFKGLVTNVASSLKTKNENAGFVTPHNKNVLSRKALFSDKTKMALGDLKKNSLNVETPLKGDRIDKMKPTSSQLLTPVIKSKFMNDAALSTPKPKRNVMDYSKHELDVWNQKLMLSSDQFDLLFINSPNIGMAPPSPTPPSPLAPPSPEPVQLPVDFDGEFYRESGSISQDDEFEMPPLNIDFDNFCATPLKEQNGDTANRNYNF